MSAAFVADASAGIAWVHPSQATDTSQQWLAAAEAGSAIHVPTLWPVEVANALLVAVRRNRMTHTLRTSSILLLSRLNIHLDTETSTLAWTSISDVAVTHNLSVYDAAYLELATRKKMPLATCDAALRSAATRVGVELL